MGDCSPLEIAQLVTHFIRRHLVEDEQQSSHDLICGVADSDKDSRVMFPSRDIRLMQRLEVGSIVREQRSSLAGRKG